MDRAMSDSVKSLLGSIVDPKATNWSAELESMNQLGDLTSASFEPSVPEPAVEATPAVEEPPIQEPQITIQVPEKYLGKNLEDQTLLKALVEYHQLRMPVLGAKTAPRPTYDSPKNVFSPMEIPIVDTSPKSPQTPRILRTRGK